MRLEKGGANLVRPELVDEVVKVDEDHVDVLNLLLYQVWSPCQQVQQLEEVEYEGAIELFHRGNAG